MNVTTIKTALKVFAFTSVLASNASAGNEGPSGGDGIRLDGHIYSLDLVEAGIEKNAYLDENSKLHPNYENIVLEVAKTLHLLNDPSLNEAVAGKLIELSKFNLVLTIAILETLKSYSWNLVKPTLVDVSDEESVLDLHNLDLVQLALRQINAIRINRDLWAEMDTRNKAALILHECVYALIKPEAKVIETPRGENKMIFVQSSPRARQIVGRWFTGELESRESRKKLFELILNYLPWSHATEAYSFPGSGTVDFIPYVAISQWGEETASYKRLTADEEQIQSLCKQDLRYSRMPYFLTVSFHKMRVTTSFATAEGRFGDYSYRKFKQDNRLSYNSYPDLAFRNLEDCLSKLKLYGNLDDGWRNGNIFSKKK